MNSFLNELRVRLRKESDEKVRISGERFFREEVKIYGIRTATALAISREFFKKIPDKGKSAVFGLCEELWRSGYMEESFIACNWSYSVRKQFEEKDIEIFSEWIDRYVTNWASCDTFCNHTIGESLVRFPSWTGTLKEWAASDNRWMRRAAAVSFIIPARKGLFLDDVFEIAGILLTDSDDMVRKGYGWMLKAASQSNQGEVYDFVIRNRESMPRTSLRYAIEKMPREMKIEAMKK